MMPLAQNVNVALSISAKCDNVYASHSDMRAASFAYLEVFHNRKRLHLTLGYHSPVQFLEHWSSHQNQEILVA